MAQTETLVRLLERARAQDESAMAEILRRFRPLIRKLSRDVPASEREDLEQELNLLVMRIVRSYEPQVVTGSAGRSLPDS